MGRSSRVAASGRMRHHPERPGNRRQAMTTIVESVEISRTPADVFAYVTDPSRLPEWQTSVVNVQHDDAPVQVGKQVVDPESRPPRNGIDGVAALPPARGSSEALTERFVGMSKGVSSPWMAAIDRL